MRPPSRLSNGSMTTAPPAPAARAAASCALSTQTYVPHAVTGGAACGREAMAATSRPRSRHMKCCPPAPGGIVSCAGQPKSPV
jgi:hypothetical protein